MIARKKLSAIVITSSGLGSQPIPIVLPYSCSKSFSSFLGQGLSYELEGKIDCLSWECNQVETKLLG